MFYSAYTLQQGSWLKAVSQLPILSKIAAGLQVWGWEPRDDDRRYGWLLSANFDSIVKLLTTFGTVRPRYLQLVGNDYGKSAGA